MLAKHSRNLISGKYYPSKFKRSNESLNGGRAKSPLKKCRYRLQFDRWFLVVLTFFESLKVFLINMVKTLIMSAKMASPGLLKI